MSAVCDMSRLGGFVSVARKRELTGRGQATRTLRIFLSHTVSGQAWQREGLEGDAAQPNPETGENIPAWQLRIDGRMLEVRGRFP